MHGWRDDDAIARIEATKVSIAIPFPPIRPEEIHVQWYGEDYVDGERIEKEEVIKKPVERGWGIWYQADVIARRLQERQRQRVKEGETIGAEGSLRVLGWMDRRVSKLEFCTTPNLRSCKLHASRLWTKRMGIGHGAC